MKLRKAYIFVLSFLSLSLLFSVCYYLSYQHALRQFNKRAVERSEEFAALHDNITPAPAENSPAVEDTENNNDNIDSDETVAVDVQPEPIILPTTKFILEIYDQKKVPWSRLSKTLPVIL